MLKVRLIVGAAGAYACLSDDTYSMDVRLPGGRGAAADLRILAEEFDTKAQHCTERAKRMLDAADILDKESKR